MHLSFFSSLCKAALVAAVLLNTSAYAQDPLSTLQERTFNDISGLNLPYRLFVPENYDPLAKYPLVLYLHGSGERGTDNRLPLDIGEFAQTFYSPEVQTSHPSFFLVPQAPLEVPGGDPRGEYWVNNFETYPDETPHPGWSWDSYRTEEYPLSMSLGAVTNLIPSLLGEFSIDSSRLYVTGWSMGGDGTWDLLARNPGLFAAGAPIAGMGDPTKADLIASTPLWVFHGAEDTAADPQLSRTMVSAIQAQGGNIRYTEYADGGHYIVAEEGRVYQEPGFTDWLFAQKFPAEDNTRQSSPQELPEPGTLTLLALGGAFLIKRSCRRGMRP